MRGFSARSVALGAALITASAIVGCSNSGGSGVVGASSPTAAGEAAGTAGSSPGKTAGTPGGTASAKAGTARATAGSDPRSGLPTVAPTEVTGVSLAAASSSDLARFAPVTKASGGLLVSSSVKTLKVAGDDVGGVAVYRVKPGLAKSSMFQDQYVVQLINAVAGRTARPRFVRADGQVVALSSGPPAVAGWFEGNQVVLLYRQTSTPDLAALALGVRSAAGGR